MGICYAIEGMALPQVSIRIGGHLTEFRKAYQDFILARGGCLLCKCHTSHNSAYLNKASWKILVPFPKREPGTKSVIQDSRLKTVAETARLTARTDQVIANKKG
jgi:hypothetical protein